ncbi:MAG: DUF362 domain-containing protein [Bryobacteraceae bacterium]|jgi:uncharacterized protein (DUF362 family)
MNVNRREFMAGLGAAGLSLVQPPRMRASAPTAPVAIARCKTYGPEFLAAAGKMFDQLGGMGRLVKGKTVSIKINLTGGETTRLDHLPQGRTFWTHPRTVGAVIHLLDRAGARRIRVVEGAWAWPASLEEFMLKAGWDPDLVLGAAPRVELINTNMPYKGKTPYTRFQVPRGGHLFPAFDLSTAYAESDVLISMAKIKEHATAGVTLSIKNLFGISPTTIYGDKVPLDEPAPIPYAGRGEIGHAGSRQPPRSSPPEKDPTSPRDGGYRIPRFIADLAAAAPVSLAILEGIETIAGAELPDGENTRAVSPGVLVAGTNAVTTDAVGMAVMGFDPRADRGHAPFETCDNTLRLAEELGVGTRDLGQIEVVGTRIQDAVFNFREHDGPRQVRRRRRRNA